MPVDLRGGSVGSWHLMFTTEVFLQYYIIQVQKATPHKSNVQSKQRSVDYTYRCVFCFRKKQKAKTHAKSEFPKLFAKF